MAGPPRVSEAREALGDEALARDLYDALTSGGQLFLAYQPRMDLRSGEVASAEALLRWRHPERGPLAPDQFIPVAERFRLMPRLTDWVIDAAFADYPDLGRARPGLEISVNVSSRNLTEPDFVERLTEALGRREFDPRRLELEVTENELIADSERTRETMARLVGLGIALCIDDFGAGHSNLEYLREFPTSVLKIDRQFVSELATNARDRIIVKSIISLAHALDYVVVAEGVEDAETLDILASWECDEGQGFYISRPLPRDDFQAWLKGRTARHD